MTLTQLKYVVTVAGEKSMNEAEKKLFISQPSLSAALSELGQKYIEELSKYKDKALG